MKKIIIAVSIALLTFSCIPDNVKEKMAEGMKASQKMFAEHEFKKALSHIELHKLRNGQYPNSLSELQFLTAMDSSIFNTVTYTKIDTAYELNLKFEMHSLDGQAEAVRLTLPAEFWDGLGCVKSNVK